MVCTPVELWDTLTLPFVLIFIDQTFAAIARDEVETIWDTPVVKVIGKSSMNTWQIRRTLHAPGLTRYASDKVDQ